MLYIPPYLYYEPKQLKDELTFQFTGDLEVPTALQNNPRCWRKQDISGEKHKKTIVLSDFRFERFNNKKSRKLKNTIDNLLAQGFSIYLWQSKGPFEITENNSGILHLDSTLKDCPPVHPKEVIRGMAKKQVTVESLEVMNIKDLKILAQEMSKKKQIRKKTEQELEEVTLDDILYSKYSFEEIKQAIPNLQLIENVSEPLNSEKKSWWLKNHADYPFKKDYSAFSISTKDELDQFLNNATEVKTLTLANPIDLDMNISFKEAIKKGIQINTLKINNINMIDLDLDSAFNSIEVLDLSAIYQHDEKYLRLIRLAKQHMPNLKKIIVDNPTKIENQLEAIRKNSFDDVNLNNLDFYLNHKFNDVLQGFKQQPNKKLPTKSFKVQIINNNNSMDLINFIKRMPKLNHLELGFMDNPPPPETMSSFFRAAHHIDTLNLMGNYNNFSFMDEVSCPRLTTLSLRPKNIDMFPQMLSSLQHFAPNLRSLDLQHYGRHETWESSTQMIKWPSSPLRQLQQITIGGILPSSGLEGILKLAPNLEKLDLIEGPTSLGSLLNLIPNLKRLHLEDTSTPLGSLLNQLPNLEELKLSCSTKKEELVYSLQALANSLKLKKLDIDRFPNKSLLVDILLRSPNLTELRLNGLKGCNEILENLAKSGITFPQLKIISLQHSDLNLEGYKHLKSIAPNLNTIDLSYSKITIPEEKSIYVINHEHKEHKKPLFGIEWSFELPSFKFRSSEKKHGGAWKQKSNNAHEATHKIDAHTTLDDIEYHVPRIFTDLFGNTNPSVNYYRNSVFNALGFTDDSTHAFQLSNQGDLALEPYKDYTYGAKPLEDLFTQEKERDPPSKLLLGKHKMRLSDKWAALPSASANEMLKAIDVKGLKQDEIEIQYSKRDNLYYIRKTPKGAGAEDVEIDYLIDPKYQGIGLIHFNLISWIIYFNTFGSGELDAQNLKGEALLEKMYEQKVGRCEQRAIMFKHFVQKQYPDLPIRVITNSCHAFVEVMQKGKWVSYCLGGYPAKLKVGEPMSALLDKTEETTSQATIIPLLQAPPKAVAPLPLAPPHPLHITWQQTGEGLKADPLSLQALASTEVDSQSGEIRGKNVLIRCESDTDVQTMSLNLQDIAKRTGREVFVIEDPAQIACQSHWLKRNADNTGESMKGPGGPLHRFLTKPRSPDPPPVLVVNWNNFSADELVRFNSLIDKKRFADNTPLPDNMVVVGLYNTKKPNAYTGSDFYSRQDDKLTVDPNSINHQRFDFTIPQGEKSAEAVEIELYDSVNWKYILQGHWAIEAGKIIFKEGQFTQALKQGKSVHLRNAPWDLPEFKQFWQEAKINESITVEGETIPIPNSFWGELNQGSGYDWKHLRQALQFLEDLPEAQPPHVVNAGNFKQWIDHYDIHEGKPIAEKSLFAKFQNQRVDLLITSPLNGASWHQLLKEANHWKIQLHLAIPEGLELPSSLKEAISINYLKEKAKSAKHVQLIDTNDVSMSLEELKRDLATEKPLVVDISECTQSDLLYRVSANFQEDNIQFDEKWSDIFQALQNKKTVILKGHFSPEMINALLPLSVQGGMTVNGKFHPFEGKLILLSDRALSSAVESEQRTYDLKEKISWILNNMQLNSDVCQAISNHHWPENFSLAQIQGAILHYLRSSQPSFDLHEGILKAAPTLEPGSVLDLSESHVNEVCENFDSEREKALMGILSSAPFAFIGGKTGVGKSTFVSRFITPANGFSLYNEMTDLTKWASDQSPDSMKVLFLDEANIANKDYTLFEGLYEIPPRILVNDTLIRLTENHKVVLAGNPMSYGGERHLPRLLAEHGNACSFNPLPVEYVYREILKPIFAAANISQEQALNFSNGILRTYQHICAQSEEEILISPRELKMMAMMIISSKEKEKQSASIIYEVAKQCLPDEKKAAFGEWFHSQYPDVALAPGYFQPLAKVSTNGEKFILTQSRAPIYQALQRLLTVRELTQQSKHEALKSPGLGGMLLEGEPGSGKSHFIIDVLLQQGYTQIPLEQIEKMKDNPPSKGFYVIKADLAYADKKRFLLQAFEQGVPVVCDEINSGPMMEQLLNALLMGVNPDTKKGPKYPGFLLLATQNPISMAGRQATSRAISRRLLFHEFHPYDEKEMKQIFTQLYPKIAPTIIDEQIKYHTDAVKYAKAHHLEPEPVFRDLYQIITKMSHSNQAKVELQLAKTTQPIKAKEEIAKIDVHIAARDGKLALLEEVLGSLKPRDINNVLSKPDLAGNTLLDLVCRVANDPACVELLVEKQKLSPRIINRKHPLDNKRPIECAIEKNNIESVKILLNHGASLKGIKTSFYQRTMGQRIADTLKGFMKGKGVSAWKKPPVRTGEQIIRLMGFEIPSFKEYKETSLEPQTLKDNVSEPIVKEEKRKRAYIFRKAERGDVSTLQEKENELSIKSSSKSTTKKSIPSGQ